MTGEDEETHLEERLSEANLRVKKEKCLFLASSVVFLGHKIDADGLHPLQDGHTSLWDCSRKFS